MRLGVCTGIREISKVEKAGYDYVELSATEVLAPDVVDEKEFDNCLKIVKGFKVKPEVFCRFLPENIKVVGPNFSFCEFKSYVDVVIPRARRLGGEIIVWGSGDSRNIPEGFSKQKAREQFKQCLEYTVDICLKNKLNIGIEILSRTWSNWLNTIDECLDLIEEVDRKEVGITADVDHIMKEEQSVQRMEKSLLRAGQRIFHVHFRDNNGQAPGKGTLDFKKVAETLVEMSYRGRGSIEAKMDFEKELKPTKDFLNRIFGKVG